MNNLVQLAGALAADPELKKLSDGTFVVNFRLRTYRSANSQAVSNNSQQFFNLIAWGNIAMEIERNFRKGSQIMIRGELRNRLYVQKGKRQYQTEIHVYEFLSLAAPTRPTDSFTNNKLEVCAP